MAAMTFSCNGLLLCCVNLPNVFQKICQLFYPLLQFIILFYWGRPSFGLKQFWMVYSYCVTSYFLQCYHCLFNVGPTNVGHLSDHHLWSIFQTVLHIIIVTYSWRISVHVGWIIVISYHTTPYPGAQLGCNQLLMLNTKIKSA